MGKNKAMKRKLKQQESSDSEDEVEVPAPTRSSDEPAPKKVKWINKQRVLVFASRGISHRDRHLMTDIRTMMPHSRPENKMERKENLSVVNEMCEFKNCNKAILLEGRHRRDLYMWLANVPTGPSAKFLVENVYTMAELKLTGNSLKGSRPLLSFATTFDEKPHYSVLKELLIQIFGTPNAHPQSQPFFDHIFTFSIVDSRIWFRNYQILSEDGALAEIGPRFVLNPVKIFDGSFGGSTLWENPNYISPSMHRRSLSKSAASKYLNRVTQKAHREATKPTETFEHKPGLDDIFVGDTFDKAGEIIEREVKPAEPASEPAKKKPKKKKAKQALNSPEGEVQKTNSSSPSMEKSPKKVKVPSALESKVKKLKNKKIASMKLKKAKSAAMKGVST